MSDEQKRMALLDRCLDDIRAGRRTLAQCLDDHPEARDELEALLPIALAIEPPQVTLPRERKQAARSAFAEALHAESQRRSRWSVWWQFAPVLRPAITALLIAVVMLSIGGLTSVSAQAAQPGDALYSLKLTLEEMRLATTGSAEARARAQADRAAIRLAELQSALERRDAPAAQIAAEEYERQHQRLMEELERATGDRPRLLATMEPLLNRIEVQAERIESAASAAGVPGVVERLDRVHSDIVPRRLTETIVPATSSPTAQSSAIAGSLPAASEHARTATVPVPTATGTAAFSATASPATVPAVERRTPSPTSTVAPPMQLASLAEMERLEELLEEVRRDSRQPRGRFQAAESHLENAMRAAERGQLDTAAHQLELMMTELEALYRGNELSEQEYTHLYGLYTSIVSAWGETPRPRELRANPTSTTAPPTPTQTRAPTATRENPPGREARESSDEEDEEPRGRGPDGEGPPGQIRREADPAPPLLLSPTPTVRAAPAADPTRGRGNSGNPGNPGGSDNPGSGGRNDELLDRPGGNQDRPAVTATLAPATFTVRVPPGQAIPRPQGNRD